MRDRGMLVELNDAFLAAEADDDVRVVILGSGNEQVYPPVTTWGRVCPAHRQRRRAPQLPHER